MNLIFRHCSCSALWKRRPFIEPYVRHLETEEPHLIGYFWNSWPEFLASLFSSFPIWYITMICKNFSLSPRAWLSSCSFQFKGELLPLMVKGFHRCKVLVPTHMKLEADWQSFKGREEIILALVLTSLHSLSDWLQDSAVLFCTLCGVYWLWRTSAHP